MTPGSSIGGSSSLMNMHMERKYDKQQHQNSVQTVRKVCTFCSIKTQENLLGNSPRFKCISRDRRHRLCVNIQQFTGVNRVLRVLWMSLSHGEKNAISARFTASVVDTLQRPSDDSNTLLVSVPVTYMHCGDLHLETGKPFLTRTCA